MNQWIKNRGLWDHAMKLVGKKAPKGSSLFWKLTMQEYIRLGGRVEEADEPELEEVE